MGGDRQDVEWLIGRGSHLANIFVNQLDFFGRLRNSSWIRVQASVGRPSEIVTGSPTVFRYEARASRSESGRMQGKTLKTVFFNTFTSIGLPVASQNKNSWFSMSMASRW